MNISKKKLESLVHGLPDEVDTEEVMYRLYLLQKIETGENDAQKGHTLSNTDAIDRLSNKWRN
ncbi:MAG: hypothetical protein ACE5G9_06930 [Nitrospinales bacterium]